MAQAPRLTTILDIARRTGRVQVEDLARDMGVTVQTIRRDLAQLAADGKLDRVHGGALLPSTVANIGYQDRRTLHDDAKAAIAARCARDIPDGCALFLNIGTTTEAVARALLRHRDIMVLTNNLNVANILADNPDCAVIVVGGMLRRTDGGLVGTLTTQAIRGFRFDLAIMGCSALDVGGDMLDYDIQEVGVSQTILEQARAAWVVADQSKLTRRAPVRIGTLQQVARLYTDTAPPAALAARGAEWGTQVVVAGQGAE